jgi:8-oxo-dGTP pyrophosphatase MutT (NUDIX family)
MGEKTQRLNREFSSGGVVFKKENNQSLWLVIKVAVLPKSSFSKNTWRLPKGWLDDAGEMIPGPLASGKKKANEEEIKKTALKEVEEEGGVEAKIIKKIGTVKYFFKSVNGRVLKFVTFYLMEWIKDLPEGFGFETSEIGWLPFEEAYKKLSFEREKQILKRANDLV